MEWLARAFVPAIFRDLSAADQHAAEAFVELLLLTSWNPALPMITSSPAGSGNDSSNSTLDTELSSQLPPADVVSIDSADSDARSITGPTGTAGQRSATAPSTGSLFAEGSGTRALPIRDSRDSDTDDDTSRVTAPESTAVESFKMSPPSTHESPNGSPTTPAEPEGPAWTTQVDQEDVLSSLEFANAKPLFRAASNDLVIDEEIDDLELEELETL